jgi:hypothetical protein
VKIPLCRVKSGAVSIAIVNGALAESEPLVPVNVTLPDPVAEVLAKNVTVVELPEFKKRVVSFVVIPAGKPLRFTEIVPENPFTPMAETVTVWFAPAFKERDDGLTDKVKDGGPSTVNEKVAECDNVPLTPVAVTVTLPTGAAPAATERVTLCDPPPEKVSDAGDAVTPAGSPLKETETLPENESMAVT